MANPEITVRIETDAGFDDLAKIAGDIGELVDMIPEYQLYEAEKVTKRIQNNFAKLLKCRT